MAVDSITFKEDLWLSGPLNLRNETHVIMGSDKKETFRCDLNTNKAAVLSTIQQYRILKNTTLKVSSVQVENSYWLGHMSRIFWSHKVLLKIDAADNSVVDSIECWIENQHQKNIQYHLLQYIVDSYIQFNYRTDLTNKPN